jgi:TatD DNase family protein
MPEFTPGNTLGLIDSHAHLDLPQFDTDRDEVIQRAKLSGLTSIINAGTDLASSQKSFELAQACHIIYAAVGIHPQESTLISQKDIISLSSLARKSKVVAIGEIGLDFYRDYAPHEQQIRVFQWQLALAAETTLPVIIHSRQADKETLSILADWRMKFNSASRMPGVIHCFNGNTELAQKYLELGFYISLGSYIGYPSSKSFRAVVRQLPVEKLLIETDCPFLPPQSHRGHRNEPSYVVEAAKELANIKGLSMEVITAHTSENARRLFGISTITE